MRKIWNRETVDTLMGWYEYEPITGEIHRTTWLNKGPKTKGAVGSLSMAGDKVLTVAINGKYQTFRLCHLAVLLMTGKQYEKVWFKNGDRLDIRWENIVFTGKAYTSQEDYEAGLEAQREYTQAELMKWREAQRLAAEERVKDSRDKRKQGRMSPMRRQALELRAEEEIRRIRESREARQRKLAEEERKQKEEEEMAVFYKKQQLGITSASKAPLTELEQQKLTIQEEAFNRSEEEAFTYGFWTGMNTVQMNKFVEQVKKHLADERTPTEIFEELKAMPESAIALMEKWRYDFYIANKYLHFLSIDELSPTLLRHILLQYTWKDKEVPPPPQLMPRAQEWLQQQYDRLNIEAAQQIKFTNVTELPKHSDLGETIAAQVPIIQDDIKE